MTRDLEQLAIDHHAAGGRWNDFWNEHADAMRAAVPCFDRDGFRKLYARLLALVVSGDLDGCRAVGDEEPWLADEAKSEATRTPNPVGAAEILGKNGRSGASVAGAVAD